MKKIILFSVAIVLSIPVFAQITLEHTYDSYGYYGGPSSAQQLYMVKLEVDGNKYVFVDKANKLVKFYNLNHSPWKTISFASVTSPGVAYNLKYIMYISQHLFDIDDEIEFLFSDNEGGGITQVINEDGSILFTANQLPFHYESIPQEQVPIYNTNEGTKMILNGGVSSDANAYVYSLAGTLSAGIKGYTNNEQNNLRTSVAYPNPARTSTRIDYVLPNTINKGEIVFYDTQGKEVKRFNVDRTFDNLTISTEDLQSGIYYYNLQTSLGNSEAKKLVTIK